MRSCPRINTVVLDDAVLAGRPGFLASVLRAASRARMGYTPVHRGHFHTLSLLGVSLFLNPDFPPNLFLCKHSHGQT